LKIRPGKVDSPTKHHIRARRDAQRVGAGPITAARRGAPVGVAPFHCGGFREAAVCSMLNMRRKLAVGVEDLDAVGFVRSPT